MFKPFLLAGIFALSTSSLAFGDAHGGDADTTPVELHMVSVSEGNIRTGDRIHGPEVNLRVNRPDSKVVLALGSRSPVRFLVTADAETAIDQVLLYGAGANRSEVFVNGEAQDVARPFERSRVVFKAEGQSFREMLKRLTDIAGVERVSSFQAEPQPSTKTLLVSTVSDIPSFQRQYLPAFLEEDRLTDALRLALDTSMQPAAMLTGDGFSLTLDGQQRTFPITLDVPPISHPVAAAHDPETNRLFGVTLGGEGFLYQYDMTTETWSVLSSMENRDATGMIYDPVEKRLLISLQGRGRDGGVFRQWTDAGGLQNIVLGIRVNDLPGLTDIFEPGGGRLPYLVPLALDGRELLVRLYPSRHRPHHRNNRPEPMSRTYIFNLESGDTALVAYNGD